MELPKAFAQAPESEAEADAAPSTVPAYAAAGVPCPGAGASGIRSVGRNGKRILDVERPVAVAEKACGTCKQVLPASEFHRSSKRKDGLQVHTILRALRVSSSVSTKLCCAPAQTASAPAVHGQPSFTGVLRDTVSSERAG